MTPARAQAVVDALMAMADAVAKLGTDDRVRVGCVVASPDLTRVYGVGYNGMPAELPPWPEDGHGGTGSVHAEARALMQCGRPSGPTVVAVTMEPCLRCASLIIEARHPALVLWRDRAGAAHGGRGLTALALANVAVERVDSHAAAVSLHSKFMSHVNVERTLFGDRQCL